MIASSSGVSLRIAKAQDVRAALSGDDVGTIFPLPAAARRPDCFGCITRAGRGLVSYDARELPAILGKSTSELAPEWRREVIHRDEMILHELARD